jgi:hypothetical protein
MNRQKYLIASGGSSIIAGLLHALVVSFEHITPFPPLEFGFFMTVGVFQVVYGYIFVKKPSSLLYYLGVLINGGVAFLWVLTRTVRTPFMTGTEHIDTFGIIVQSLGLGSVIAGTIWFNATQKTVVPKVIISILLITILGGLGMYGNARVMEYVFPDRIISHGHGNEDYNIDGEINSESHNAIEEELLDAHNDDDAHND